MSTAKVDMRVDHSHHFDSQEHEYEACKQGVWLFMVTELMMFGGLFVGYFVYRAFFPDMYVAGGDSLDWRLGALNTLVLLISSFTMAQGVTETMKGNNKKALNYVIITTICAFAFMVVKYFEYTGKIANGLFPGEGMWNPDMAYISSHIRDVSLMENFSSDNLRLFYVLYFAMTGLHGLHIVIGIGLMFWIMKRLKNNEFGPKYFTAVEGVGIYWHIVDIIWIFLFPLMYLI